VHKCQHSVLRAAIGRRRLNWSNRRWFGADPVPPPTDTLYPDETDPATACLAIRVVAVTLSQPTHPHQCFARRLELVRKGRLEHSRILGTGWGQDDANAAGDWTAEPEPSLARRVSA
jgi:hypothetical protein